jgi:hypothetical protein
MMKIKKEMVKFSDYEDHELIAQNGLYEDSPNKVSSMEEGLAEISKTILSPYFLERVRDYLTEHEKIHYTLTFVKKKNGTRSIVFDFEPHIPRKIVRTYYNLPE